MLVILPQDTKYREAQKNFLRVGAGGCFQVYGAPESCLVWRKMRDDRAGA